MLGDDLLPPSARRAYDALWMLEHLLYKRPGHAQVHARRQAQLDALSPTLHDHGDGYLMPAPVHEGSITPQELATRYMAHDTPVVLRGAASQWPCVQRWTPEFFEERFGDDEITLINVSIEEVSGAQHTKRAETATLRDVITSIRQGTKKYSRFAPLLDDHPELLADLDAAWLASCREPLSAGRFYQMFIGGKGTNTHLHAAAGSNLFTQVYGTKRWMIIPPTYTPTLYPEVEGTPVFFTRHNPEAPDLKQYPLARVTRGWELTLEAGDVLYVPPFFWHQVWNLSDSIGVGFRWYGASAIWRSSPLQLAMTLTASNPPLWVVRQQRANFSKVYGKIKER